MIPGSRVAVHRWVVWQEAVVLPVSGSRTLTVAESVPVALPALSFPLRSTTIGPAPPASCVPAKEPLAFLDTSSSSALGANPATGSAGVRTPPPGIQSPGSGPQLARQEIAIERSVVAA